MKTEGLQVIIVTIMIPNHKRVEDETIQILYELFTLFTLANPNFLKDVENDQFGQLPKIVILFNNFEIEMDKPEDSDGMTQEAWFNEIRDTIRELIAFKIVKNISENKFKFNAAYQRYNDEVDQDLVE